jgi:hypothetical protein
MRWHSGAFVEGSGRLNPTTVAHGDKITTLAGVNSGCVASSVSTTYFNPG